MRLSWGKNKGERLIFTRGKCDSWKKKWMKLAGKRSHTTISHSVQMISCSFNTSEKVEVNSPEENKRKPAKTLGADTEETQKSYTTATPHISNLTPEHASISTGTWASISRNKERRDFAQLRYLWMVSAHAILSSLLSEAVFLSCYLTVYPEVFLLQVYFHPGPLYVLLEPSKLQTICQLKSPMECSLPFRFHCGK